MRTIIGMFLAAALATATTGCKSDCAAFGSKLCSMACDCTAGDECAFTDSNGFLTISFDDKASCRFFYVNFGCPRGGDVDPDFDGCSAALDDAVCVDTDDGAGALEIPDVPACEDAY
jgi:hypothetical protein